MKSFSSFPKVSIVSINYDTPKITCEMLASLKSISYPNIEIIVVDNASPTTSPEIIKQQYPEIKFIESKKNLGFAGGNNLGIEQAIGKYILLLNNDTEVKNDFLEPLVNTLKNNTSVGIVSSKIIYYNTNIIQYAGATPLHPITSRNKYYGALIEDNGNYNKTIETAYPHGASMLFKKEMLQKTGLLYEKYFLYYEELDFAEKVKKLGYKIIMEPKSIIYHKESISTGKNSPLKTYYLNRNRLLFLRRNSYGWRFILASSYFLLISTPKNILANLLKPKHLLALYKGLVWNFTHFNIHSNYAKK